MDIESQAFYFMQIPALISLITEMIVPLSYFLFKDLRQFKYIQLVLLISIGIYTILYVIKSIIF